MQSSVQNLACSGRSGLSEREKTTSIFRFRLSPFRKDWCSALVESTTDRHRTRRGVKSTPGIFLPCLFRFTRSVPYKNKAVGSVVGSRRKSAVAGRKRDVKQAPAGYSSRCSTTGLGWGSGRGFASLRLYSSSLRWEKTTP